MLFEGLEQGDLKRLVHTELHIDEFKSKLGKDEDVCVVSFKVRGKEPANDADVSSGEMDDGDYIVFVECERDHSIPANIMQMMHDIMNVTAQKLKDWRVRYYKGTEDHTLDTDTLKKLIPQSAAEYHKQYGDDDLESMKAAANIKTDKRAPKNDFTESLRIAAGLR